METAMESRRERILEALRRDGRVRVSQLAQALGTSEVTIRGDLGELESAGMLERVHGGAVPSIHAYYNLTYNDRAARNREEKRRIAAEVAADVRDGETLLLGAGTTTMYVAAELRGRGRVTVVTNSLAVVTALGESQPVILLGGAVDARYLFTYGDDTLEALERYRADKAIIACDGVSAAGGLSTYHHQEVAVNRAMLARARLVVVAADYTKIGRESFAHIAGIEAADRVVTNREAPAEELEALRGCVADVRAV